MSAEGSKTESPIDSNVPNVGIRPMYEMFKSNKWEFETDIELVEPAVQALREKIALVGWEGDDLKNAAEGFKELLLNAIGHGSLQVDKSIVAQGNIYEAIRLAQGDYPERKKRKIKVIFNEISAGTLSFTIINEGEGFDPNAVPDPTLPDPTLPENASKPRGWGLLYVRVLHGFEPLKYGNNGREVTAVKRRTTSISIKILPASKLR